MEYLIESEIPQGFIIASSEWFDSLSEHTASVLVFAFDRDGKAAQMDYEPGETWEEVWLKVERECSSICNSGDTAIAVSQREIYTLEIETSAIAGDYKLHFSNLIVKDEDVFIALANNFLEDYFSKNYTYKNFTNINLPLGKYEVYVNPISKNNWNLPIIIYFKKVTQFSKREIDRLLVF